MGHSKRTRPRGSNRFNWSRLQSYRPNWLLSLKFNYLLLFCLFDDFNLKLARLHPIDEKLLEDDNPINTADLKRYTFSNRNKNIEF